MQKLLELILNLRFLILRVTLLDNIADDYTTGKSDSDAPIGGKSMKQWGFY